MSMRWPWWLLCAVFLGPLACQDDGALPDQAVVAWHPHDAYHAVWGRTYYGSTTIVGICPDLPPEAALYTVKHELLHAAGLKGHPFDRAPCFNAVRTMEATEHGPCEQELAWLRAFGARGLELNVGDAALELLVVEAATLWNEETGVRVFASVNGVDLACPMHEARDVTARSGVPAWSYPQRSSPSTATGCPDG